MKSLFTTTTLKNLIVATVGALVATAILSRSATASEIVKG